MVQGKTKGLTCKTSSSRHAQRAKAAPKKGKKYIAPKKDALVKQASVRKNLTAKINKSIEQQMVSAASPGGLMIMKTAAGPSEGSSSKKSKGKPKP